MRSQRQEQVQEKTREKASRHMHPAIRGMIDRYGVTPATLEFLEAKPLQYINGRFTAGDATVHSAADNYG